MPDKCHRSITTTAASFPSPMRQTAKSALRRSLHYHQQGQLVWAEYRGGAIVFGTLIAKVVEAGCLEMRYQHLNAAGELMTGRCHSMPEVLPDGRLRLHESWQWTSGDGSAGTSIVEEMRGSR